MFLYMIFDEQFFWICCTTDTWLMQFKLKPVNILIDSFSFKVIINNNGYDIVTLPLKRGKNNRDKW